MKDGPAHEGFEQELFEIRDVGDLVQTNERIVRMAPNTPNLRHQTEKFALSRIFSKFDLKGCYNQCELEEKSRNVLTVRTPIGKIRSTRMIEGQVNAGVVLQARINMCLAQEKDCELHG